MRINCGDAKPEYQPVRVEVILESLGELQEFFEVIGQGISYSGQLNVDLGPLYEFLKQRLIAGAKAGA